MLFARSGPLLTHEATSPWPSLMAKELSDDRGMRWRPASLFMRYPLLPTLISMLIQKELYKSIGDSTLKYEICLLTFLRCVRSGTLTTLLEALSHQNSLTARTPPPLAHQLVCPWLRIESSEYFSRLEILGPSGHAPSPEKSSAARFKTLGWLEYPPNGNGLGPRAHPPNGLGPLARQQQHLGPLSLCLKAFQINCGPTLNILKQEMIIIAHQPFKPWYVYFHHRTSLISLMFQHPVLVGRRLLPSRVATSLSLVGLMDPFEGLNFLKNFDNAQSLEVDWKKAQVDSKKILAQPHQSATARHCKPFSFVKRPSEAESKKSPINLKRISEDFPHIASSFKSLSFSFIPRSEISCVDDLDKKAVRSMTTGLSMSL